MGKFVLKVALSTVAAIFAVLLLVYGFFALFLPAPLASFYENLGNYSGAVRLMKRAYDKSESEEDLKRLAELLCFKEENAELSAEYVTKYCDGESFKKYCKEEKDGQAYYDLMTASSVKSFYIVGKPDDALKKASEYLAYYSSSYPSGSSLRALMFAAADKKDKQTLAKILEKLNSFDLSSFTETEKATIEDDKQNIQIIIG
ncbi:MAG TPA: hypothetical protein DDY77_02360 [Clostridiales bacterium]|nr:hypothetical protein [Clostridiales bacterium]